MKIIFGLGNHGEEYTKTRHNAGFMFLDCFTREYHIDRKWERGFLSLQLEVMVEEEKILLVKPLTFMNASGDCVREYLNFYKIKKDSFIIVHDDLDIPLGGYKIALAKGPVAHRGILDVEEKINNSDFWRIRIGIDNRKENNIDGRNYVLNRFINSELEILDLTLTKAVDELTKKWIIIENSRK